MHPDDPEERNTQPSKALGVAISGGGHRAALWGLGTLLYLVDAGLNRDVRVISSVSGGSITNGVVGKRIDFRDANTNSQTFRAALQPLVTHITKDGLFFYGSRTNAYLWPALALAATTAAAWLLVIAVTLTQIARYILDSVDGCVCPELEVVPAWAIGLALSVGFGGLAVSAAKYAERWDPVVTGTSVAIAILGVVPAVLELIGDLRSDLEPTFPLLVGIALLLVIVTLSLFSRRSRVAQRAMDREHFEGARLDDFAHAGRRDATHHVICATELQSGLHAYFTDRFIYNFEFGVSRDTAAIDLAQAVQSSAALPGGFAPQRIPTTELTFVNPETGAAGGRRGRPMILVDGGVYDNMAEQWFAGFARRHRDWVAPSGDPGATFASLLEPVDQLIVSNASTGWSWRPFGGIGSKVSRLVRESQSLGRAQEIMYNTIGRRRRAHLFDVWKAQGIEAGAFVEVDQDPRDHVPSESRFDGLRTRLEGFGISDPDWSTIVSRSRGYPTVLRRIRPEVARSILWHAYVDTAIAVAVHLGRPIPETLVLPRLEEFATSDRSDDLRLTLPTTWGS